MSSNQQAKSNFHSSPKESPRTSLGAVKASTFGSGVLICNNTFSIEEMKLVVANPQPFDVAPKFLEIGDKYWQQEDLLSKNFWAIK